LSKNKELSYKKSEKKKYKNLEIYIMNIINNLSSKMKISEGKTNQIDLSVKNNDDDNQIPF